MTTTTEANHAQENAQAHLENIIDLLDRIENGGFEHHDDDCEQGCESDACRVELSDDEREAVREELRETALSLLVRGDWHVPGAIDGGAAVEYEILLTTGSPALRIRGDLDLGGTPTTAGMQYQDWGTPWTEFFPESHERPALLEFATLFYFGD